MIIPNIYIVLYIYIYNLKILINAGADVNTPGPSEDLLDLNKNILINKVSNIN